MIRGNVSEKGKVRKMNANHGNFTDRARKVIQLANLETQKRGHDYIGTGHFLLGLRNEGTGVAACVLKCFDADICGAVEENLNLRKPDEPELLVKKVLVLAKEEAAALKQNYVGTEHLLLGLLRLPEGMVAEMMSDWEMSPESVRQTVLGCVYTNFS